MIHHLSIDAQNPLHVASVLAEILQGEVYKFLVPGSYILLPFDNHGTHIVVFKQGDVWAPGADAESAQVLQAVPTNLVASHVAILIATTQQQVEYIGQREGWRVVTRVKGDAPFSAIEFWVENRLLFELFPPEFAAEYLQFMHPQKIEQLLGQPIQSPLMKASFRIPSFRTV
jgi:hypothetical protein